MKSHSETPVDINEEGECDVIQPTMENKELLLTCEKEWFKKSGSMEHRIVKNSSSHDDTNIQNVIFVRPETHIPLILSGNSY